MPACGHSTAPRFDGNALNLCLYFDKVESLSIDPGLNEEGKIWHALHYASWKDNELWSTLPEAEAQVPDYARFHDAVVKLYPGADDERKYAESNLQQLIDTQQQYSDNPNTTQTLEYIKDKYNAKIRKWKGLS
jgi:hypothetical protein